MNVKLWKIQEFSLKEKEHLNFELCNATVNRSWNLSKSEHQSSLSQYPEISILFNKNPMNFDLLRIIRSDSPHSRRPRCWPIRRTWPISQSRAFWNHQTLNENRENSGKKIGINWRNKSETDIGQSGNSFLVGFITIELRFSVYFFDFLTFHYWIRSSWALFWWPYISAALSRCWNFTFSLFFSTFRIFGNS